jgi:hypothetical protein
MIYRRNFFRSLIALGISPFTRGSFSTLAATARPQISDQENSSISELKNMKSPSVSSSQKANEAVVRRYANSWEKNDLGYNY